MLVTPPTAVPLPAIFVPKEMISDRVNRFLQTKHAALSQQLTGNGPSRQDTRSIWYTKEHVQTWLDEMNLMGADGMRVYFGAYGPENAEAQDQLCLLMVLTRAENGLHKDIVLENEPDFFERQQLPRERSILNDDEDEDKKKPKEYNYGSPCPPLCPGSEQAFPL